MTSNEVEWARRHDWFRDAGQTLSGNWIIRVAVGADEPCDYTFRGERVLQFADFEMLRQWAGY